MQFGSFEILAELAIALAGFAAVAAAFGGRERSYGDTERIRMSALFLNAGVVLVGCGVIATCASAGLDEGTTIRTAGAVTGLAAAASFLPILLRSYRLAAADLTTIEPWAIHIMSAIVTVLVCLCGFAVGRGEAFPLVASFWLMIVTSLWLFWRLLTRSN